MRIETLLVRHFRNIQEARIEPHPRFNLFEGENGAGKTNLLEAIYVLGNVRSFREGRIRDLIRLGEEKGRVNAVLDRRGRRLDIRLDLEPGRKRFAVNEKVVTSFSDYLGTLVAVVFSPTDLQLLRGPASERRRFMDRLVCGARPAHLADLQDYEACLRTRNQLLKDVRSDRALLEIYTDQLIPLASRITARRLDVIERIRPTVQSIFSEIFDPDLRIDLAYACRWRPDQEPPEPDAARIQIDLAAALAATGSDELRIGYTLVGPQRDDLGVMLDGLPVREYASQGQLRASVLALKITEIRFLEGSHGDRPVLLLDDVSSELDQRRTAQLFELIRTIDSQTFITTTDRRYVQIEEPMACFEVESGAVRAQLRPG